MMKNYMEKHKQVGLLKVMEDKPKRIPAKRVDIVSLKLVKEASLLYKERIIKSPDDGQKLMKKFLQDADREHFIVISLNTKNEPVNINVCHIGSLNASLVHPREVFKPAILSNVTAILK